MFEDRQYTRPATGCWRELTEFREEAVKWAMTDGVGILESARRLSISMKMLAKRVRAAKAGDQGRVGQHQKRLTEVEAGLGRVQR